MQVQFQVMRRQGLKCSSGYCSKRLLMPRQNPHRHCRRMDPSISHRVITKHDQLRVLFGTDLCELANVRVEDVKVVGAPRPG
jgi:hypothetical protein